MCADLPHEAELTLHVGVNSGHGIARILGSEARMDYAVLGDSVILAQRLESAAPTGETYVSELTCQLAGDMFEFEPVGELTLKGKSEPVPAWRLIGRRRGGPRRTDATSLLGRREELAQVSEVLDAVSVGPGGVLSVTGEAGIGKSRLTDEVRRQADEQLMTWLHARCLSYGGGLAYWPYAELLRTYARVSVEDSPEEAAHALSNGFAGFPDAIPYFLRLLGLPGAASGPDLESLEPEAFRRRLHEAFASWLRARAAEAPTVFVLEDIHWADASSVELTKELALLCSDHRLVLYLVGRPESAEILSDIAPHAHHVEIGPLGEESVGDLVEHTLGGRAAQALTALVLERTGGNPFFVQELVRAYRDTDALVHGNGKWRMRRGWDAEAVPPTVEGVLAARIDLLPRTAANALQAASVIGRRVRLRLLAAVGPELADLGGSIDRLVADGFLDRVDASGDEQTVSFHHALVQDVAYSRLLRRRKRQLHQRVAEIAEELYGAGDDTIDLLARHLYLGEAGAKAVEYLVRAGERARGLFANDEAILHLGRAAELARSDPDAEPQVAEIELALAELSELVGDYEEALRLYASVRDATADVRAWQGLAAAHRSRGEYRDALDVVDTAFHSERLRDADLTPLWLEQGRTLVLAGRLAQAIEVLEVGLAAAGDRRDPVVGQLLLQLTRPETLEGQLDSALEHALQAKLIFEEHGELRELTTTARLLGDVYRNLGRLDDAAETLRNGLELAQRVGSAEEIGGCLMNLGIAELDRGQVAEAITCIRAAIDEFERIGHGSGRVGGYANLAFALAHAGDFDEAERMAEQAIELARSIGHALWVAEVVDTMAFIAFGRGALSEAALRAEEAAGLFLELGAVPKATQALEFAARAWEDAGEEERARDAAARARNASVTA